MHSILLHMAYTALKMKTHPCCLDAMVSSMPLKISLEFLEHSMSWQLFRHWMPDNGIEGCDGVYLPYGIYSPRTETIQQI